MNLQQAIKLKQRCKQATKELSSAKRSLTTYKDTVDTLEKLKKEGRGASTKDLSIARKAVKDKKQTIEGLEKEIKELQAQAVKAGW